LATTALQRPYIFRGTSARAYWLTIDTLRIGVATRRADSKRHHVGVFRLPAEKSAITRRTHVCGSGDPKTAQGKLSCYQQPTCAALP
jgi:hypothetical protein